MADVRQFETEHPGGLPFSDSPPSFHHFGFANMETTFENVRIVSAYVFNKYQRVLQIRRSLTNRAFAQYAAQRFNNENDDHCDDQFVAYHAWLPGYLQLSFNEVDTLRALVRSKRLHDNFRATAISKRLETLGWGNDVPVCVDAVAKKCVDELGAMQNKVELTEFLNFVRVIRPKIVVEIGTAHGGSLYGLAQVSDRTALVISVDLPGGPNGGGQSFFDREMFASFVSVDQRIRFVPANSLSSLTRRTVERILDGQKIDLLFIDGDHSYGTVRSDFQLYGELVSVDGFIAVHDISLFPERWGMGNEVGVFWRELASTFPTRMIVASGLTHDIVEHASTDYPWGIGIIARRDML